MKKIVVGIGVVVVLIAVYFGVKIYAENIAEKKVNEAIAKAAVFSDIDYKNVNVDLLSMDVRVSDIVVSLVNTQNKIKIGEIVLYDIDDKSDIPSFLSMAINGIELNIQNLGENVTELTKLGYKDKLLVNLTTDYAYSKEKKELHIKGLGIGADEAGEIRVSLRLGNITLESEELLELLASYQQIIFHEAKIEYTDDSLVERLIELLAKEQQVTKEDYTKIGVRNIEAAIAEEKDEYVKNVLSQIKGFIINPKRISISASPSKPQPLGRIMRTMNSDDPKDIINFLNIQIVGNGKMDFPLNDILKDEKPKVIKKSECLKYEPATVILSGKLESRTYPGAPNFESVKNGDEPETGFYLLLENPICMLAGDEESNEGPIDNVTLIQLVNDSKDDNQLRSHLGKIVKLKGSLFAAFTGHHHAPLLLHHIVLVK